MHKISLLSIGFLSGAFLCAPILAQEEVTIVASGSEAAEGLDLQAVAELFKEAENLEEFEKALNDPEVGVNNLDLDDDGEVDFIRVVERAEEETRIIILQVPLAEKESQDVATIEVEKIADDQVNLQCHGNEIIYGPDYYVAPTHIHVHTWPIIAWIYRPAYRPYRSAYYFGYYPRWWRPYRAVTVNVYRTRTVRFTKVNHFSVTRKTRVTTVKKVKYQPRTSTRIKKSTTVTRTTTKGGRKTTVKKKTTKSRATKTTVKKKATRKPARKNNAEARRR